MTRTPRTGDRVIWRGRTASVLTVRMAPPDYREPEAYSILLDDIKRVGYAGTFVDAREVEPLEPEVKHG